MNTVQLNSHDNVAIIIHADPNGIPRGHKIAIQEIQKNTSIIKLGHTIGFATRTIHKGEHVHTHNVVLPMGKTQYHLQKVETKTVEVPKSFLGYLRSNGEVGTRNYIVVAASVNCSASVVKAICRRFEEKDLSKYNIDGVVPLTHAQGCGQEIGGFSYNILNKTLAGWVFHPNVVGAVVIGLGCEGTTLKSILEAKNPNSVSIPMEFFSIQEAGGTNEAITQGCAAVENVLQNINSFNRTQVPVAKLKLALNCGGSDAFSTITANPVLGFTSDLLVAANGTVVLAEIPECYGAEHLLLERASSDSVRKKLLEIFTWWEKYTKQHNVEFQDNLSAGNIAGGITTIIEKSLGAITKSGSSPLNQALNYAEAITEPGFVIMNTPGFDPASVTGLVAGGCNMVAFTTGRGSVYGCSIAPTIKISTTTQLFQRMKGDMDFNAGAILEGETLEQAGTDLYRLLIDVASGKKTCSEKLKLGWEEFVPWAVGEVL